MSLLPRREAADRLAVVGIDCGFVATGNLPAAEFGYAGYDAEEAHGYCGMLTLRSRPTRRDLLAI